MSCASRSTVQVACEVPAGAGSLELTQKFPANLEQLAVVVKKVGDTRLSSPQISNQQDMTAQGETFIAATGGPVAAGRPIALSLDEAHLGGVAIECVAQGCAQTTVLGEIEH